MRFGSSAVSLVIVLSGSITGAHADFLSGNDLYEECRVRGGQCAPHVEAFTDMLTYYRGNKDICIPRKVSVGQLADIFVDFARKYPKERSRSATVLFSAAMKDAYPC